MAMLGRTDAQRSLLVATAEDQKADGGVAEAAALLRRILLQDLEAAPIAAPDPPDAQAGGDSDAGASRGEEAVFDAGIEVQIRRGVAPDRVVSVGDPEMRVGHKSERSYWEGYKAHASVECSYGFLTGVAVSDATAYDGDLAPELLRRQQAAGLCPEAMVRSGQGRTITLHPLEPILQAARAAEQTHRVQALLRQRLVAERALAHLMGVGLRQARYVGRAKVEFQALTSALVVNLRRLGSLLCADPTLRGRWRAAAAPA